jgi:glycosyltransferase involved in cell wall biosynthesis
MIVAYNALSLRPGVSDGGATYTLNLLARLPESLPDAQFVVFVREGEDRVALSDRVDVRKLARTGTSVGRVAVESFRLGGELRRAAAAVLISPNESLPLRSPCPIVVIAQNLVYHRDDRSPFRGATRVDRLITRIQAAYYRTRMARAYSQAAAVVAVSKETARVLQAKAGLVAGKTVVVHEGSDSLFLPDVPDPGARRPRLLVVSALAPYKNLERTLEIFGRLHAERPELELLIVGSDWRGYAGVVRRSIDRLGLSDAVRIQQHASGEELATLYAESTLLLYLSSCESFGLPVLEAMRFGLPAVVADRSSLPEVAAAAALVVDPDDAEGATAEIARLLASPDARERLAELGHVRAQELTWRRAADEIGQTVRDVVSGRSAGR